MVEVADTRTAAILRGIAPLWTPHGVHELRVLKTKQRTVSGYFNDPALFAQAAAAWDGKAPGVYITLNPVTEALLGRAYNRVKPYAEHTTNDEQVVSRRWIPLDFDAGQPPDVSSSDEEHQRALTTGRRCCLWLLEQGVARDAILFGDSGNGAHILVRVDLPNDDEAKSLVERVLHVVSGQFTGAGVDVDVAVQNAARIWKVPGTHACKGDDLPDRPHREAHWIQVPGVIIPCPDSVIAAIAEQFVPPPARAPAPGRGFDIDSFIARYLGPVARDPKPYQGGRRWQLRACPFNPDHTGTSAAIIEGSRGGLAFKCLHNGCAGRSWSDLRALFEPRAPSSPAIVHALPAPPHNGHGPRGQEGGADPLGFPLTDLGNGERFHAQHGDDALFCKRWNQWLVWDGTRFAQDDTLEIERRATATIRSIYREAAVDPDETKRAELAKHAVRSENISRVQALVTAGQKHCAVTPEIFDADPWLFNCANGTLDLRTGELHPHARENRMTKRTSVAYDPDATCPLWLAAIDRWMKGSPGLIAFLQRALGYSLTGVTTEECFFFAHGPGRNGKSVCIRVAEHVIGEYAQPTRPETIIARNRGDVSNDIAALLGARFVPTVEVEEGARLAEGLVKQLTGGDRISARFLYGEFFSFTPAFKLWLVANHRPMIRGTDPAIWERVRLIPFTETIPEKDRDHQLTEKLKGEAPGILTWMAQGCLEWQRRGLDPPSEVLVATNDYREEMDTFSQFLEDRCIVDDKETVFAASLYEAYTEWCSAAGERAWSKNKFGRVLTDRGFKRDRAPTEKRDRIWLGIGLSYGSAHAPA